MDLNKKVEINYNKLIQVTTKGINAGIAAATLEAHQYITKRISKTQPIHVSHPGKHKRGLNPSKPGEYPKVVERRLLQGLHKSILKTSISSYHKGRIIADTEYAMALEMGGRSFLRRGMVADFPMIGWAFVRGAKKGG